MAKKLELNKAALFKSLGYQPHPGQKEVHDSAAARRVLACGVRFGKSLCAAMECIAAAMAPAEHSIGWVVGPTYDLADRVFNQIVLIVASHLKHRIVKISEHERRIVLRNLGGGLSEIRGKTADNALSLLGEGLDYLVIDEAARLKPTIWESHLSQRLIDKKGWALLISTPRGKGWFYDLWKRGQAGDPHYKSWNLPSWSNPLLDRAEIEAERGRLPERVFLQEYEAQFLEGSGSVFRYVRDRAIGEWQNYRPGHFYSGGLDLAKVEDYTVLTILNHLGEVVFLDRFHRLDWALQIGRIKAGVDRFPYSYTLLDSTGAGEPVYEQLLRSGVRVNPYPFTAASKSNLINNLALALEQGTITLPRPELAPELIDELESFEYSVTDAGNVRTGAPSGMHDDTVMSLALGLWQSRKGGRGGSICVLNTHGRSVGNQWRPAMASWSLAQRLGIKPHR